MAKIERTQKLFLKSLKEKFQGQDVQSNTAEYYKFGGIRQSARKMEFVKASRAIEMDRGISMYDWTAASPCTTPCAATLAVSRSASAS